MRILIVTATGAEIQSLKEKLGGEGDSIRVKYKTHTLHLLITGAGMVQTAWAMGNALAGEKYDLAVNAGIAGSFTEKIKTGDVVLVQEDILAELGAEDGDAFISAEELGIQAKGRFVNTNTVSNPLIDTLPKAKAITVNRVHGNTDSIQRTMRLFTPDIESMEGAAFFYCCEKATLLCLQLRAISNKVEKRNKASWDIPLAIKNLNEKLLSILDSLS